MIKLAQLSRDEEYLLEVLLWSEVETSEDGIDQGPLDDNYSIHDIDHESIDMIISYYREFRNEYLEECINSLPEKPNSEEIESKFAMDYILSCNGHGAGFFDSIWHTNQCGKMQELCRQVGSYYTYVHDGIVYISR